MSGELYAKFKTYRTCHDAIIRLSDFPDLDWTVFRNNVVSYIDKNLVVKYKDGIKELLDFLKESGIKIGLASGTDKSKVMDFLNRVVKNSSWRSGSPPLAVMPPFL